MRKNRASNRSPQVSRRKPRRGRTIAFEPLGSRIALSGGGVAPFVFEMNAAPRLFDAPTAHTRALGVGEFNKLAQPSWQRTDGGMISGGAISTNVLSSNSDGLRNSDGLPRSDGGWRQQDVFLGASELDRPPMIVNAGVAAHQIAETRVAAANVQVSGTNVVLPGLLVSRGDTLTLLVSASPLVGLPFGSPGYLRMEAREPSFGERIWTPKVSLEPGGQPVAISNDGHHNDGAPGTTSPNPGAAGSFTLSPRASDAPPFSAFEPSVNDVRVTGGWDTGFRTAAGFRAETDNRGSSAPTQAAPITGQWAISKTELDEGLIELESPLTPRRKGRKLPGDPVELSDHPQGDWSHLQTLAEQVWSAWNEVGRNVGSGGDEPGEAPDAERTATAEKISPRPAVPFNADAMDGLVELVMAGAGATDVLPGLANEYLADDDAPVRIDAGVAIFQQFEIATAADAAQPATARKAEPKAESDERAEAEKPAEGQSISAAAVGAGLVIGLPFSLRRHRQVEAEGEVETPRSQTPRLRTT